MRKTFLSGLAIVTLFLVVSPIDAQRPECPDAVGACFIDISDQGFFGFTVDGEGDTVIIGPLDGDNDFFRISQNGAGVSLHQVDRVADVYFCAADPGCSGGVSHVGSGRVSANVTLTPGFGLSCPSSIHVNGDVTGPSGNEYSLRAVLLLVGNSRSPSGCRVNLDEVEITPR